MEEKGQVRLQAGIRGYLQPAVLAAGGMYLFYYMALGSFLPYINLYYERLGMTGVQIGILAAVPVLIGAVSASPIGGLTDAYAWHHPVLRLALILCPISIFLLSQANTFLTLIPFIIAYAIFNSPIVPILDSSALEVSKEHKTSYGGMRLWGSAGWAVSTLLIGWLIEETGIRWLFFGYILLMSITFLVSLFQKPRKEVLQSSFRQGLKTLLGQKSFLLFLLSVFFINITSGGVLSFFSIYMDSIGAGETLIGLGWTLSALSEIPVMLMSGRLIQKIGANGLLVTGIIVFGIRWLLMSYITDPHLVLGVQLLHGLSFAAFLVGSVSYINEHTPGGLNTTALALYNAVGFGLGNMTGSLAGGVIYDQWGLPTLFRTFTLVALIGLGIFLAGQRASRPTAVVG